MNEFTSFVYQEIYKKYLGFVVWGVIIEMLITVAQMWMYPKPAVAISVYFLLFIVTSTIGSVVYRKTWSTSKMGQKILAFAFGIFLSPFVCLLILSVLGLFIVIITLQS